MASAAPIADHQDGPDLEAFVAFLREEETKSRDEWLDGERTNANEAYNGEPYGDEEEGRSQVVTRDVAEVVDYTTTSILRTMISGDSVVEFQHSDKDVADEATAAVNYEFYQGQDGYRFLHDWIKAGLIEKTSVAKTMVIAQEPTRREAVLSVIDMAAMADSGVQFIASAAMDPDEQQWMVAWLEEQPPIFRDYVSPNEETSFALDARDLDDDCVYLGFHMERTLSQLASMGFDTEDLPGEGSAWNDTSLAQSRNPGMQDYAMYGYGRTGANRKVVYHEEYSLFDLNGDGIAERVVSHRVGTQILTLKDSGQPAIFEMDEQPGVAWCPFPMPHRIVGQSLADKVMDIQRINSVLMRQGLDNLYQTNAPRVMISESAIGDNTIDDLMAVRANGVVRYQGAVPPTPLTLPFAAQSAFDVMEVMRGEKESRTGITRLNQGLDADALNKTATGTALMQAQGQQMEDYQARNFAEAFARLMLKKYRLMRRFGRPMEVTIDGQPRQIDPRRWPDDMKIIVRVGLGTGRKDQRIQNRMMLLGLQKEAAMSDIPITNAMIFQSIQGLVKDLGLGVATDYWPGPETPEPEPGPDPALLEAQAKAAEAEQKIELERQKAAASLDLERQKSAHQLDIEREKNAQKMELEAAKADQQALLAERRAQFEASLARQQQEFEEELAVQRLAFEQEQSAKQAEAADDAIPNNRPGGDLDK